MRTSKRSCRRPLALAAPLVLAAGLLAGCSSGAGAVSTSDGFVQVTPGITEISAAQRESATKLSGTTIDGTGYAVAYGGHVTVINVWGSWCTPCRVEAPSLSEAAKNYASKGVRFLGINTRDNDAAARAYDSQFGITYPSLADPDETLVLELKSFVPSGSVPTTLIVDRKGKVAVRAIGGITEPELDKALNYALSTS